MILTPESKKEIFTQYGGSATNTGEAESQIALFSHRITHLTGHLKTNRKDFNTQRSLLKLVGKRRKLLTHLIKVDVVRYREIIQKLGIRK
ncbi:MAG: 30S ribosomal protein S15 [Bacteroidetes bacterium]|nr:30S ribosomal protein S15 [Bacteroidota bacterium]